MPSEVVAAVPVDLLALPARTHDADAAVRAAAAGIDDDLRAAVLAHVARSRCLMGRAATVGAALLAAGGGAGALALALSASGPPSEPAGVLAAALGLPETGDGIVRRPDIEPAAVAWLAAALGPAALAALARSHPHLIGPVDGMPVEVRYEANRILAGGGDHLLFVDPARGRAAEVVGDLATADHVAVVVPGMGNTLERFDRVRAKAEALVSAAAALDPPESLAVVAWLGYDSPGVPSVVLDDAARAGAPDLVRLVEGLAVTAPAASRTVIGHSYGSVVAGRAAALGLDVDAVVFTGSPGVLADGAGALGPAPVYALRAPGDYVSWSEHFGPDPSGPDFGATRLSTGTVTGHVGYFDDGTDSLRNLALVATGRAAEATVVRPGRAERAVDRVDDVHERAVERPVDEVQAMASEVAGRVSWLADEVEDRLPTPVAGSIDRAQTAAGRLFEVANRFVDLTQRATSPDLVGDVVGDAWQAVSR